MTKKRVDVKPVAGLDPQVGLLLAMLGDGTREWREELGQVPEDAVVWQPFPQGHSIGALILHLADSESFWIQEVAAGQARTPEEVKALLSEETDQYAINWPIPPKKPLGWYFEQHDRIRKETRRTVRRLADPEHIGRRGEREFTLRWVLHHVITHEAYHGGQAVLLALQYAHRERRS
jgi:uncharacterized damage-inducible protein DinB